MTLAEQFPYSVVFHKWPRDPAIMRSFRTKDQAVYLITMLRRMFGIEAKLIDKTIPPDPAIVALNRLAAAIEKLADSKAA